MNNKGLWRIIEAVAAVLLVAGTLLFFVSKQSVNVSEKDFSELLRESLNEIAKNQNYRERILTGDTGDGSVKEDIKVFLDKRIKRRGYQFLINICDLNVDCFTAPNVEGELFSAERLISATIDYSESKVVRIYAWKS